MISLSDGFVKVPFSSLPGSLCYCGVRTGTPHASGFGRLEYEVFTVPSRFPGFFRFFTHSSISEGRRSVFAASRRGFTLLELIVVMFLMALGVSLITTSLGRGLGRQQPKAFVQQFVSLCRQARSQALAGGRPVLLTIDSEMRRCRLDDRKSGLKIPDIIRIEVEDRVSSYRSQTGYQLIFFPDGSSTGDRLVFSADGQPLANLQLDPLTGFILLQATREQG
jgi:general secretion pathway protein H